MKTILRIFLNKKIISQRSIADKLNFGTGYISEIVNAKKKLNPDLISRFKTVDDDLSVYLEVLGNQVQQEPSPELLLMILLQLGKIEFDTLITFMPKEIIEGVIQDMEDERNSYSCNNDVESRLKAELFDIKKEKFQKYKELLELKEIEELKEEEISLNLDLLNQKTAIAAEMIELYFSCEEDYLVDNGSIQMFKENLIEEEGIDVEDMLFEYLENERCDVDELDLVDREVIEMIVDEVQKQIKTTEYQA